MLRVRRQGYRILLSQIVTGLTYLRRCQTLPRLKISTPKNQGTPSVETWTEDAESLRVFIQNMVNNKLTNSLQFISHHNLQ